MSQIRRPQPQISNTNIIQSLLSPSAVCSGNIFHPPSRRRRGRCRLPAARTAHHPHAAAQDALAVAGYLAWAFLTLLSEVFMEKRSSTWTTQFIQGLGGFLRRVIYSVLSVGPIPRHVAFTMDGNRRYAKKQSLQQGVGHRVGYVALMNMLKYCYELNVVYVTIYAFSIENFKRKPEEVQSTMQLILEKIEALLEEESIVNSHGMRVHFIGNLKLLSEPIKKAAERAMKATSQNSKAVLSICIAYTSTDEIVHAVEETCLEKRDEFMVSDMSGAGYGNEPLIYAADIDKHLYMGVAPDPDVIIRSSGETRLSNFLLWQSGTSILSSPRVLWPDIGFWHLVQAIIEFQRNFAFLEKKRKQS